MGGGQEKYGKEESLRNVKRSQSHIMKNDRCELLWSLGREPQTPDDWAMELPVQKLQHMEGTWLQWWFPHLGQVIEVKWMPKPCAQNARRHLSQLFCYSDSLLTAQATLSPPPTEEGPLGPAISPEPPKEEPDLPACTLTPSYKMKAQNTIAKVLVSFNLQMVPN